jgi:uncharacterized iron-regulated membrane protein
MGLSLLMRLIDLSHRWTGGFLGLLLAILGLTGALLVHRDAWIMLPHAGDAQVQTTQVLAATAQRIMGDPTTRPDNLTFASRNFGLDRLTYPKGAGAYTDQSGVIVTRWTSQWERPELWLLDLHHHLFSGDSGETIIGIAAVAGLFFVVTGALLWWRTRKTFALRLLPARMSRPAIVRHHRDIGIIAAPLLLLSLATGAILVFRPIAALIIGPGAPAAIDRALSPPPPRAAELSDTLDWARMITLARSRFPDAEVRSLSLPRKDSGLITIRMRDREEWLPNGRTTMWFAADTGNLVAARDARQLGIQVRAYNTLYPLHAAKIGGLAYRLVMTLSGLALCLLGTLTVWTFWFKRPKMKRRA